MTRLAIATPRDDFVPRVRQALTGVATNGDVEDWSEGLERDRADKTAAKIAAEGVEVVAVGPDVDFHTSVALAKAFDRRHPEVSVVLVAQPSARLFEVALRSGVREVIAPDSSSQQLREVLTGVLEAAAERRQALAGPAPEPEVPTGKVIAVLSPKGGAGKTTVASNLAVGIAKVAPKEVVVVDLDLQFGDVANTLRLMPEHTMVDAIRVPHGLDATTLKVFLTSHPSGLYALCAPESPADAEDVTPEHVTNVVRTLAEEFPYVVLDGGSGLDDHVLAGVDQSTDLVLVCATDVPAVRGMRKQIEVLDMIAGDKPRHLVLNRSDARVGLSASDIQSTIGLAVDVSLPSSRSVPVSTNQGTPILESDQRTPVTNPLLDLVERFVDLPKAERKASGGGSLFSLRRKR